MKKIKFFAISTIALISLTACGADNNLTANFEQMNNQASNIQTVNAQAKKSTWKVLARKKKSNSIVKNMSDVKMQKATIEFEFDGKVFTSAGEETFKFLERYSIVQDWVIEEMEIPETERTNKKRYRLTLFGPVAKELYRICTEYRDYLKAVEKDIIRGGYNDGGYGGGYNP